ncbi:hypothetical protein UVIVOLLU_CDS0072 [Salmonella phage PHA46_2]
MVYNKHITTLLHSYHHPTFDPPCAGSFLPLTLWCRICYNIE